MARARPRRWTSPAEPRCRGSDGGTRGGPVGATEATRGGGCGGRKDFPEKARLTRRGNVQRAFVFFHTEAIKALKRGFGTKLHGAPSLPRRFLRFDCSARSAACARPHARRVSAHVAAVARGHVFWPWVLRNRLFLLCSVSAAPCNVPCAGGLVAFPPPPCSREASRGT